MLYLGIDQHAKQLTVSLRDKVSIATANLSKKHGCSKGLFRVIIGWWYLSVVEMFSEFGFVVAKMASKPGCRFAFVLNVRCDPCVEVILVVPNLVCIFDRRNRVPILAKIDTRRK